MSDVSRRKPSMTVGIDLGDKYSYLCVLDTESGEVIEEPFLCGNVPQDISHLRDVRPQILSSASRIGVSPPMISKVLR